MLRVSVRANRVRSPTRDMRLCVSKKVRSCSRCSGLTSVVNGISGKLYLFVKTIERAHTPAKMWERIPLSNNYTKALEQVRELAFHKYLNIQIFKCSFWSLALQIDSELIYWPNFLIHKCKQRVTKITQYLIKMRKLGRAAEPELVGVKKKIERREARREQKALSAAKLERSIEKELLERLKSKAYGDAPLNVNEAVWNAVLASEKELDATRDDADALSLDEYDEEEEEEELGEREFVSDESDFEELSDIEDMEHDAEDDEEDEGDETGEEDGDGDDDQPAKGKRKPGPSSSLGKRKHTSPKPKKPQRPDKGPKKRAYLLDDLLNRITETLLQVLGWRSSTKRRRCRCRKMLCWRGSCFTALSFPLHSLYYTHRILAWLLSWAPRNASIVHESAVQYRTLHGAGAARKFATLTWSMRLTILNHSQLAHLMR